MNSKDPEEKSILKEDEESPVVRMDEDEEEQSTASPAVSHIEYNDTTGEHADNQWSEFKLLSLYAWVL